MFFSRPQRRAALSRSLSLRPIQFDHLEPRVLLCADGLTCEVAEVQSGPQVTSLLADTVFSTWATEGSSASVDTVENAEFSFSNGANSGSLAMMRATINGLAVPTGEENEGLQFELESSVDFPALTIAIVDADGSWYFHREQNVQSGTLTTISIPEADLSTSLNPDLIRGFDFLMMTPGVAGTIDLYDVGIVGQSVAEEEVTDPPVESVTQETGLLEHASYSVWAPAGSSASLDSSSGKPIVSYSTSNSPGAMSMLRTTLHADAQTDLIHFGDTDDLTFQFRFDDAAFTIALMDANGSWYFHRVGNVVPGELTAIAITAGEMEQSIDPTLIRSFDILVLDGNTAGVLELEAVNIRSEVQAVAAQEELPKEETPEETLPPEEPSLCEIEGNECIHPGDEEYFQSLLATPGSHAPTRFYVQPGVQLDGLHVFDQHGDEIHFMEGASVVGEVQAQGHWNADRGVFNIEASSDLLITGLDATNTYQYQRYNHGEDRQSSTAVNISWSHDIVMEDSVLTGNGKLTVWIQGNSDVEMKNTEIDCYYFCVGIAASDVYSEEMVMNQFNPVVTGDRHAAIWVSSTMRAPDGQFYGTSNVEFHNTTVNKQTGESMIVGNGGHDWRSNVKFSGRTEVNRSSYAAQRKDGWMAVHRNYFGITLTLEGDYPTTREDFASDIDSEDDEMARFVMHTYQGTGHAPVTAPMIVCMDSSCVSTNDLFELE